MPEETLARSDPAILAIGDCTSFPEPGSGRRLRPESVQNANDQARTAPATLQGREAPYAALPWFWSEQGGVRLQMAGLMPAEARATAALARRLRASRSCTTWENTWSASKASTRRWTMWSRKLLEAGKSPPPAAACDPATPLKSFL